MEDNGGRYAIASVISHRFQSLRQIFRQISVNKLSVLHSFPCEYLIRYFTYAILVKAFTLVVLVYVH